MHRFALIHVCVLAVALAPVAAARPALAAAATVLVNADERPHDVAIIDNGERVDLTIEPGEVMEGVCERCTLSLEGAAGVSVQDDERAVIRGGALRIEPPPTPAAPAR